MDNRWCLVFGLAECAFPAARLKLAVARWRMKNERRNQKSGFISDVVVVWVHMDHKLRTSIWCLEERGPRAAV